MVQWFPGHMAQATTKIKELAAIANLFIVVLDARAPLTSYNEDFDQIAPHLPRLFLIAKADLADPSKLVAIKNRFNNAHDRVLSGSLKTKHLRTKVLKVAMTLLAKKRAAQIKKGISNPVLKIIVIGMPNVGKSTLINLLVLKAKAKVANIPAVTTTSTWFQISNVYLLDTPGVLWPKTSDQNTLTKLALLSIIKSSLLPPHDLFYKAYSLVSKLYPLRLEKIGLTPSFGRIEMHSQLIQLCENKKFVKQNGALDIEKGINFFVNYVKKLKGVTYD